MKGQTEKQAIDNLAEEIYKSPHVYIPIGRAFALARYLYTEKGYRKQIEGEWTKHPASYEFTVCKNEFFVDGYAEDYDPITDWDLHFCPNCGAHMRKEDEGK